MSDLPNSAAQEIEELEYLNDVLAARLARLETANDELIPAEILHRLMSGEAPVRVWREYRSVDTVQLAQQAGIAVAELETIESGSAEGSLRTNSALARVLRVDLEDLLPWPQEDTAPP